MKFVARSRKAQQMHVSPDQDAPKQDGAETARPLPAEKARCQVALLTPPGRGAVASLVVFGNAAVQQVAALFAPATARPLNQFPTGRIVFGRWLAHQHAESKELGKTSGEELIVVRRNAWTVEVHCHGGSAATDRIMRTLVANGCLRVSAASWLAQHEPDPLVAEARLAIAQAATTRTATILLDQIQGSLTRAIRHARESVTGHRLHIATRVLQQLLGRVPLGLHLTVPWRVTLIGPTNVGKSSLINAILGYQRALVGTTAGTTRDVLTDVTAIDGWLVELADTAGLRGTASKIEQEGVRRAQLQAASADLVLLVTDLGEPWTLEHQRLADRMDRPLLLVHNKSDRVTHMPADRPAGVATSALELTGIDTLVSTITRSLVPQDPPPAAAIPFHRRHERALRHALQALDDGRHAVAEKVLNSLLTQEA